MLNRVLITHLYAICYSLFGKIDDANKIDDLQCKFTQFKFKHNSHIALNLSETVMIMCGAC